MNLSTSFRDASIKRKLMLIGLLTSGLGLLFISLILATESWVEWRDRMVSDMTTYAHMIGANASSALLFNDMDAAKQTLSALAATPDIVDAVIYDKAGKTFARFSATQHSPSAFHPSVKPGTYLFDTDRLVVSEPIQFNGKVLGSIYLESDLMGLRAAILDDIAIIFITAFAVFLVTALMFGRLQKTIVAPIMELADGMRVVTGEQDYAVRVAVHSKDEVGTLADTFNVMLERIQQRSAELVQHREHLEEEVALRTASLTEAQRIAHLGSWEWDIANDKLDWSDEIYHIFGLSPRQFDATYETFLQIVHPEDLQDVDARIHGALEQHRPYSIGYRILLPDGTVRHVHEQAEVFRNKDGHPIKMRGTVQDISERKRAETEVLQLNAELEQKVLARTAALEQARLKLEQASRGKDEFLAAISHELKTPLNHILGFADLLKEGLAGELTAEQKEMAQDIFDAGSKQLALVNSLIELARLQAGKVKLQAKPEEPAKMLCEIATQYTAQAQASGLDFAVEVAEDMGEMLLDRKVVTHVLDQLLSNAFKFTPSGGKVSLAARRVPRTDVTAPVQIEAEEYLELAVADNGPGIAPEALPRLFQPFVQGDGGLNRSYGGTGVGLILVKLLAELHGGGVKSEPGAGAKFMVWLPLGKQP